MEKKNTEEKSNEKRKLAKKSQEETGEKIEVKEEKEEVSKKEIINVEEKPTEVEESISNDVLPVNKELPEKAKNNPILIVGIALAALVVLVLAFCFIKSLFSKRDSDAEVPLIYMVDGEMKFITSKLKKAVTVGEINEDDVGGIRYSTDGTKYLFTENDNLYLVDISKKGEKEKIASDVDDFGFSNNDKYIIFIDEDDNLFVHNYKDKEKLDSDVGYIKDVVNNQIYYEKDGNLYVRSVTSKDDKTKIVSDYDSDDFEFNEKKNKALYSKKIDDEEELYDYYVYDVKSKKSEKVLSDVYEVVAYSDDFKQFIYTVANEKAKIDLSSLVEDDKKEADEKFVEYSFKDYMDDKIDYETYSKNQDEADEIEDRNRIREQLENKEYKEYSLKESYDVYYITGDKKEKVASEVDSVLFADYKTKRLVVTKRNINTSSKIKLSEVDYISEIIDKIEDNITKDIMLSIKGTDTKLVVADTINFATIVGNDVYASGENSELFHATISGEKAENIESLGEDVEVIENDSYEGGIIIITDAKDGFGDLKIVKDGKAKLIDNDVYSYNIDRSSTGKIYYYKDYEDSEGDLYCYDGKARKILEDIGYAYRIRDDYMYILKDYSSKSSTYDLYRYKGKKLELIDYGVES